MKIVSAITIAVVGNRGFLLFRRGGKWGFAYEEFDRALNGNMNDTAKRAAVKFIGSCPRMDYVGSFLKAGRGRMLVMYDFVVRGFSGEIGNMPSKWVKARDVRRNRLDSNTLAFLEVHGRFL